MKQRFFYCPKCGGLLEYRHCKERRRLTCVGCGYIFYENPVVGVAAIVMDERRRILLGRRRTNYRGLWCIPCGYVEYDEDVYVAVVREFKEETGLDIVVDRVFTAQSNFHNPEQHTVGIWFMTRVTGGQMQADDDLDELAFFDLGDLPPLAFPADRLVLNQLLNELNPVQRKPGSRPNVCHRPHFLPDQPGLPG